LAIGTHAVRAGFRLGEGVAKEIAARKAVILLDAGALYPVNCLMWVIKVKVMSHLVNEHLLAINAIAVACCALIAGCVGQGALTLIELLRAAGSQYNALPQASDSL
jgi:hypothetical protein